MALAGLLPTRAEPTPPPSACPGVCCWHPAWARHARLVGAAGTAAAAGGLRAPTAADTPLPRPASPMVDGSPPERPVTSDGGPIGGLDHRGVLATMTVGGATTDPGRNGPGHAPKPWCAINRTPLSLREEPS